MDTVLELVSLVGVVVLYMVVMAVIMALPTMWLWNWLMPEIFGLKTIGVFQALGLNLLCSILLKSRAAAYEANG